MRNDGPSFSRAGIQLGQDRHDVLIGKPVKTVPLYSQRSDGSRQCESLRHLWLAAMKRGIEAGDLRLALIVRRNCPHRGYAMRLVQWCKGNEPLEGVEHGIGDQHGPAKLRAPMHYAVSDRDKL